MILKTTDEIIGALEKGNVAKDFAAELQKVMLACQEQEGKGSIRLKLAISAKEEFVSITATIDTVIPRQPRRTSNFYLTREGQLSMAHPDQVDMQFVRARREAADVED